MDVLKQWLTLLFGAIVVALVLSNPQGVKAILSGLAGFTGTTVTSFLAPGSVRLTQV